MKLVLALLPLTQGFRFFRSEFHFTKVRWHIFTDKFEVDLNLLRGFHAALAGAFVDEDFFHKLVEHGCGQGVKTFIFIKQGNEPF